MLRNKIIFKSKKSILFITLLAFCLFFAFILATFSIIYFTAQKRYADKFYKEELESSSNAKSVQIEDYFKMLSLGMDVNSFTDEMEKGANADNFIIFNESGEILFYKDRSFVEDKKNISSVLSGATVRELLNMLEEKSDKLFFKDGSVYIIKRLPSMQSYLVTSTEYHFTVGFGNLYLATLIFLTGIILLFLIVLYTFVKRIIDPLYYLNNLTNTILKEVPIHIAIFGQNGERLLMSQHLHDLLTSVGDKNNLLGYFKELTDKEGFFEATKEFKFYDTKSMYFKVIKMNIEQHEETDEHHSVLYLSDVSEQMYLANTDFLTKVANRRHFSERAETGFYTSQRDKTPLAFIMLDIDHFKKFNDKFGHLAGDEILQKVAMLFVQVIERKTDLVGRIGGEEFAVMLHNTNMEGANIVAEKLRVAVEKHTFQLSNSGNLVKVTVSAGVYSAVPSSGEKLENFLEEADKKLYEAKGSGRNKVR
jgi:diguanylate cyclase (GGDEF)-like protein